MHERFAKIAAVGGVRGLPMLYTKANVNTLED